MVRGRYRGELIVGDQVSSVPVLGGAGEDSLAVEPGTGRETQM